MPPNISTMPPGSGFETRPEQDAYYDPTQRPSRRFRGAPDFEPGLLSRRHRHERGESRAQSRCLRVRRCQGQEQGPGGPGGGASLVANGVMLYITGDPTGKITGTNTSTEESTSAAPGRSRSSRGRCADAPTDRRRDGDRPLAGPRQPQLRPDHRNERHAHHGDDLLRLQCDGGRRDLRSDRQSTHRGRLWVHGTPDVNIAYDGRNGVEGYRSILVQ